MTRPSSALPYLKRQSASDGAKIETLSESLLNRARGLAAALQSLSTDQAATYRHCYFEEADAVLSALRETLDNLNDAAMKKLAASTG